MSAPVARRWTVAQLGAREHYAVARALLRRGELARLVTDAYCSWGGRVLRLGPAPARALAARSHRELRGARVDSFTGRALLERARRWLVRGRAGEYARYVAEGRWFARAVAQGLRQETLDPARDVFFAYDTGALEVLDELGPRGVPTIVDQIDPGPAEEVLVAAERARWPGWEPDVERIPAAYWDRLRAEWARASRVVVNSEWSRQALLRDGVPPEKLRVVPLAFEAGTPPTEDPRRRGGALQVLWLGSVCLRKGIPYLFEAARRLSARRIEVLVAGPVQISPAAAASAPPSVRLLGRVTRDRAEDLYRQADVFVLPTISDGFGLTQLEALSHGVPVVATPNCAAVVTAGVDGLIVPPADPTALADALAALDDDRARLAAMSAAAPQKARDYSVDRLGEALASVLGDGDAAGASP